MAEERKSEDLVKKILLTDILTGIFVVISQPFTTSVKAPFRVRNISSYRLLA